MAWEWYAVKSLYRWEAQGEPEGSDEFFDAGATLLEERVVLFKGRSFDEALRRAEKEAEDYCQFEMFNPYGQTLRFRCLDFFDAYHLVDLPGKDTPSGLEVYSATEKVDASFTDDELIDRRFGTESNEKDPRRKKFTLGLNY